MTTEAPPTQVPRALPHNLDAEQSLLGSLFCTPHLYPDVAWLTAEDFYRPAHTHIFTAMGALHDAGHLIDHVGVAAQLEADGNLEAAGGREYLLEVTRAVPTSANLGHYADIVGRASKGRTLIAVCSGAAQEAYDLADPDDLAGALLTKVATIPSTGQHAERLSTMLSAAADDLARPSNITPLPGFTTVAAEPGDVVVIGGRPGTGKTQIGLWMAERLGLKTLVLSYEMSDEQIRNRMLSMYSGIGHDAIRRHDLTTGELEVIREQGAKHGKHIYVKEVAGLKSAQVFSTMRKFAAGGGKVVIIDYLQLAADAKTDSLPTNVTLFSNALKRVTKDTGLITIALSQLSRAGTDREKVKLPVITDLRESGAIEQDASCVALMYAYPETPDGRKHIEQYALEGYDFNPADIGEDTRLVLIDWQKNRHGKLCRWPFLFHANRMTFEPLTK